MKKSLVSMCFVLMLIFTAMGSASAYEFKGILPLNDKVSGSFADAVLLKKEMSGNSIRDQLQK